MTGQKLTISQVSGDADRLYYGIVKDGIFQAYFIIRSVNQEYWIMDWSNYSRHHFPKMQFESFQDALAYAKAHVEILLQKIRTVPSSGDVISSGVYYTTISIV